MPRREIDDAKQEKLLEVANGVAEDLVKKSVASAISEAQDTPEEGRSPKDLDVEFTGRDHYEPLGIWEFLSAGHTICLIDGRKKTAPNGDTYWDPPVVNVTISAAKPFIDLDHPMPGEIDTQGTIPVAKLTRRHWELIRDKLIQYGATQVTPKLTELKKARKALESAYEEGKAKIEEEIAKERQAQGEIARAQISR